MLSQSPDTRSHTKKEYSHCLFKFLALCRLRNGDSKLNGQDVQSYLVQQAQSDSTFRRLMQEKDSNWSQEKIVWEVMTDFLLVQWENIGKRGGALCSVLNGSYWDDQAKYNLAHCMLGRPAKDVDYKAIDDVGRTALQVAISYPLYKAEENLSIVQGLVLWHPELVSMENTSGFTALYTAIAEKSDVTLIKAMAEAYGADIHAVVDTYLNNVLHLAAKCSYHEMIDYFCEKKVSVNAMNRSGSTPLHAAAEEGSVECVESLLYEEACINAIDYRKHTALHLAVEQGSKDIVSLLIYKGADVSLRDLDNFTPLDLAADLECQEMLDLLCNKYMDTITRPRFERSLKDLWNANRVEDHLVASQIRQMPQFKIVQMIYPKKVPASEMNTEVDFFEMIDKIKTFKESTRAVLDHFVMGERIVNSEVFDIDSEGNFPEHEKFNPRSAPLLDAIVETNNTELALHPAVKAVVDHKWNTFIGALFRAYFVFHLLRTLLFTIALLIAARPDLDNPGCYYWCGGWDIVRVILEGLTLLLFLLEIIIKVSVFVARQIVWSKCKHSKIRDEAATDPEQETRTASLRWSQPSRYCWPDYPSCSCIWNVVKTLCGYLLWVSAFILPFIIIIPIRAATTCGCVSIGVGNCICALQNGNNTGSRNGTCTDPPRVQWIFAAVAYLANAILILEFLPLFKPTGVYVRILIKIAKTDIWKFIILYLGFILIFLFFFYFLLRSGVVTTHEGQLISDVKLFAPNVSYVPSIILFGVRMFMESGGITRGYFTEDDNIMHNGYQWFLVITYTTILLFMSVVLLSLFIAQMSHSYTQFREDAKGTFALERARVVLSIQKQWFFTNFILAKLCKKNKFYKDYIWIVPEETKPWVKREKPDSVSRRMDEPFPYVSEYLLKKRDFDYMVQTLSLMPGLERTPGSSPPSPAESLAHIVTHETTTV